MPCRYDESPEDIRRAKLAREEKEKAEKRRVRNLKRELDLATRLLCSVCGSLERASGHIKLGSDLLRDPELTEWWEKHKAADELRRKREAEKARKKAEKEKKKRAKSALKKKALAKLTPAERKALGL